MIDVDKLSCDLVSKNFVDSSKVDELIAFIRGWHFQKVEMFYDVNYVSNEEKESEHGVWRCYGALQKVPMHTGTLNGEIFWNDSNEEDYIKICYFSFDDKGKVTLTKLLENYAEVEEGLLCPHTGLLFLKWSEDPGNYTKIKVNYEYPCS